MDKLVSIDEDSNIELEEKDIEPGMYENRMIAQAHSTKGLIISHPSTGKRVNLSPGNILFQKQQKETENGKS